jgi:hypothetical protein
LRKPTFYFYRISFLIPVIHYGKNKVQKMLDVFSSFGYELDICFITKKMEAMIMGRDYPLCRLNLSFLVVLSDGFVSLSIWVSMLRLSRRLGARLLKLLVSSMVLKMVF